MSSTDSHRAELILVVEDEPTIADAVASRLRSEGYQVEVAADGPSAVERCAALAPDLVVLDLNLPGFDGIEVCRRIHIYRRVPVVMLTARDDETDMLVGLGVGADDYLTKPFSPRELVARIKAVLRRAQTTGGGGPTLSFATGSGTVDIDPTTRRVTEQGEDVHLTPTEFDLLRALAEAGGAVLSRDQLLAMVWGYRDGSGVRTVDSHIRSVRSKISAELIRTVHGVGYALDVGDRSAEGNGEHKTGESIS
jgi:DNA-binding response OmpR family regulator